MSRTFTFFSGVLVTLLALPALGQTYTADQTAPYAPNTYRTEGVYGVGNVDFNNASGLPNPYGVNPDFKETVVTLGDSSELEVFDVCFEMFVGPTGSSTYDVSESFGPLTADQETAARILFSNAIDEFVVARDTLSQDPDVVGAAIQIAFWEIVEDPVGIANLSVDDLGLSPGDLYIIDFASGYAGATADAVALAETYLTNISSGTWTDQSDAKGYTYYYADSATQQHRFCTAVP